MCLEVYLVADSDLPDIPWQKSHPAFHVQRLKRKEKFNHGLVGANAYLLGSHEGCGCGFIGDDPDPETLAATRASRQALAAYVEDVVRREGPRMLLAAWSGDEGRAPVRATVTSQDLLTYPWAATWDAPHLIEVMPTSQPPPPG